MTNALEHALSSGEQKYRLHFCSVLWKITCAAYRHAFKRESYKVIRPQPGWEIDDISKS